MLLEIWKVWFGSYRTWWICCWISILKRWYIRYIGFIYDLPSVLQVRDEVVCYNGTKVSDIEALCIFLKRHTYPCRYLDVIQRSVPELCIKNNFVLKFLYERWGHLFTTMNQ